MDRVRIGIVGSGGVLRVMFGPIFRLLDNCEFAAAADPDPQALELALLGNVP